MLNEHTINQLRSLRLDGMVRAIEDQASSAAATALGEFAVTLFLSRPEWTTLTTLIHQHLGRPGAANLDAAFVLAASIAVMRAACSAADDSSIVR